MVTRTSRNRGKIDRIEITSRSSGGSQGSKRISLSPYMLREAFLDEAGKQICRSASLRKMRSELKKEGENLFELRSTPSGVPLSASRTLTAG